MAEQPRKPVLKKPPGYRDPTLPVQRAPKPPVRKPVLPPPFYHRKKRKSCCRVCCCALCILSITVVLLLLVAGGIFYIWYGPKLPVFHLQRLQIPRFNVTVKPDGTYLAAATVVRIEAKNPNGKIMLHYGGSTAKVSVGNDGDIEVGLANASGFTQQVRNRTVLKFATSVNTLIEDGLGPRLKARYRSKQLVARVEVRMKLGLGVGRWRVGMVGASVSCGEVSLKRLNGGAMPKCALHLLNW